MKMKQTSLNGYFALFRNELMSVGVFSLVTNLMMLAPTLYLLQLYDRVLLSQNELTLYAITLITCFFLLVMAFSEWMRSIAVIKAGVKFDQLLSGRLFRLGFANPSGAGRPDANEAMQDMTFIRQFLTSNGLFAFFDIPWTVIYIAILFILDPILGILAILFCTIQAGLAVWNQRSSDQPLQDINAARINNQHFLDSKIRNIETLHVLGMMPHLYTRWHAMQSRWNELDSHAVKVQTRNQHINKFVRYTMQSLMLGVAAWLAVRGQITIGAMIASNVLIARALQPFDIIVSTWRQFIQAKQSVERINLLLASEHHPEPSIAVGKTEVRGEITLRDVHVVFDAPSKTLLKNISLDIKPGQVLVVMGPSGSGKTTFARCLVGACDRQGGELLIDGHEVGKIPSGLLANSIGYLPQDIDLIEGTIVENIARFNQPETLDVIEAARIAGIHETILRLPLGYDTRVDNSAANLSGGQRQLIGLARAFYRKPAILVLDEPNSHLDEHGEASLLSAITAMKSQGKAIVIISHRHNILKIADRLLIMKNGEIAHYGSRDEVAAELNQAGEIPASQAA
ncbi:MAG: type I secretion system permease/ATPase [Betaproteobacteria bacterium HGW-Betaproteobacteria-8]|nr:MAG: type I secretion system permease/ATPase [Betaproteobacteria bacterium HGW-Betaproteobacteria-8]